MTSAVSSKGSLAVTLEGRGSVTLRPTNYVTAGGEGSIYRVSDVVVKIYHEPRRMRERGAAEKVRRLSTDFRHPHIIAPQGAVTDKAGDFVGYYMPFVPDPPAAFPMSMVFTNDFYAAEGFDAKKAAALVDRIRSVMLFAHERGATQVDPNELNYFVADVRSDVAPRVVDVDGWVIGTIPPTVAVMPSIRDWHNRVGHESDRFAFGVVSFQIFTGIHPYKGTLDGYGRGDLETRMKDNASVFTSGVRLARAVRDFACIPGPLLSWYEAAFQRGERSLPPSPFDTGVTAPTAAKVLRTVVTDKTGALTFEKLLSIAGDPVVRVFHCGVAATESGNLIDLKTKGSVAPRLAKATEIVRTPSGWLVGDMVRGEARFDHVVPGGAAEPLAFSVSASRVVSYENRMFAVTDRGLLEIKLTFIGPKTFASAGQTWDIMPATKWFGGLGVMDAMGAKFVITPFGADSVAQVRVPELDDLQVVAGRSGNRFVSVIGVAPNGEYRKAEFTFERDYRGYKAWAGTVDSPELNLAILPKGVCATIVRDGELDIFVPTNGQVTRVDDKQIGTDMALANWEDRVVYVQRGEVWSVSMSRP